MVKRLEGEIVCIELSGTFCFCSLTSMLSSKTEKGW